LKYGYSAFGIQFESDIALPELLTYTGKIADVKISHGNVPDNIHSPREQNEYYQVADNEFLFRVDGVASYYVTSGEQIIVQLFNQDLRQVRLYLLGTVMGVLLMQRGILPLHGSTVLVEGRCIVFLGVSGAGKSTLAAALRNNGHSLLADDISAVKFDKSGLPWVQPGYPQQKLWQASVSMLGMDTTPLRRICEDTDKYAVPVLENFYRYPRIINGVYEIEIKRDHNCAIVPLKGVEKIATIMHHTYRSGMLKGLGLILPHFKKCETIAKYVPLFRLTRPENVLSLNQQVDVLERHFAEQFVHVRNASRVSRFVEEVRNCEKAGN